MNKINALKIITQLNHNALETNPTYITTTLNKAEI